MTRKGQKNAFKGVNPCQKRKRLLDHRGTDKVGNLPLNEPSKKGDRGNLNELDTKGKQYKSKKTAHGGKIP